MFVTIQKRIKYRTTIQQTVAKVTQTTRPKEQIRDGQPQTINHTRADWAAMNKPAAQIVTTGTPEPCVVINCKKVIKVITGRKR